MDASSPRPPVSPLRTLLSTVGFFSFAIPGTLLMATFATLAAWIPPRGAGVTFIARVWSRCLLAAGGVRVDFEAHPDFDPGQSYVFLPNHQSYFDIPALFAAIPSRVRFAAKASLFNIPIFGWSLRAGGFIPIDRHNLASARGSFSAAGDRLRGGLSLVFFPEGTRSFDGRMGTFYRGGFLLALKSGLPIVPVGISGAFEVMSRRSLKVSPGTIRLRLGKPIDPGEYGLKGKRELVADVRSKIVELGGFDPPARATLSPQIAGVSDARELEKRSGQNHDKRA